MSFTDEMSIEVGGTMGTTYVYVAFRIRIGCFYSCMVPAVLNLEVG